MQHQRGMTLLLVIVGTFLSYQLSQTYTDVTPSTGYEPVPKADVHKDAIVTSTGYEPVPAANVYKDAQANTNNVASRKDADESLKKRAGYGMKGANVVRGFKTRPKVPVTKKDAGYFDCPNMGVMG